ncbi:hypothetical protein ES703_83736 [subsurface metagenome]
MKILWYLKQLFPLTYESEYKIKGVKFCSVWKMWFGRILWNKTFKVY